MTYEADLGPRLSRRLTYLLKRALLDLEDLHQEHLEPFGINGRELAVLLLLQAREPESQQQAAARLKIDRTTMVALLDGLESKGLVARHADDGDRRRNVVALTEAGQQVLSRATRASDKAERRLLADLDADEQAQLRALLVRIAAADRRR
ncbi:MarR family winged helix-turn-helix transcriptional regulator [uncultured Jatrophihabitans sp.]|uniref:MarR family winged helix-turn-helix transcriptional regulator n=1 Tax=uncultured Jatrophihabitans sp. TaxID=1610747 RepID=UPI0035CA5C51